MIGRVAGFIRKDAVKLHPLARPTRRIQRLVVKK